MRELRAASREGAKLRHSWELRSMAKLLISKSLIVQKKTKTSAVLCRCGAFPRLLTLRLTQYISLARTFRPPVGGVNEERWMNKCVAHLD